VGYFSKREGGFLAVFKSFSLPNSEDSKSPFDGCDSKKLVCFFVAVLSRRDLSYLVKLKKVL
jgi:hypothetical protein